MLKKVLFYFILVLEFMGDKFATYLDSKTRRTVYSLSGLFAIVLYLFFNVFHILLLIIFLPSILLFILDILGIFIVLSLIVVEKIHKSF